MAFLERKEIEIVSNLGLVLVNYNIQNSNGMEHTNDPPMWDIGYHLQFCVMFACVNTTH